MKLHICVLTALASLSIGVPVEETLEALARRTYFYVGGHYENVTQPISGADTYLVGQMYVEMLVPRTERQRLPLIFVPGAGQTSTNFLNTPDGREGWASFFLNKGFTVYLVDPPQRGRSPYIAGYETGTVGGIPVTAVEQIFTAPEKFANAPSSYRQASLHTQWPGTGIRGDPVFDQFYASQVPLQRDPEISDRLMRPALNALIDKVGACVLVAHSQAGPYAWVAGDSRPNLVKGIVAIEPEGPPFRQLPGGPGGKPRFNGVTRLPLLYDPPVLNSTRDLKLAELPPPPGKENLYVTCTVQASPPRKLVNLAKVPVALVTGEASYHAPYDWCFIEYFKQTGVKATWLDLGRLGVKGNGHFPFLEKNNLASAKLVLAWMLKNVNGVVN
ncbi:MAG: hypothetical protein Q9221_006647 [Calogaya cf. arnoldii]